MPKAASTGPGTVKRACDQCNYRRIKCNRALVCDRCTLSKLACTYDKATKPRGGKRIKELQELGKPQDEQAEDYSDNQADILAHAHNGNNDADTFDSMGPRSNQQGSSLSYDRSQTVDVNSTLASQLSPNLPHNHLSSNSHDSGSSLFQQMPTFSQSPNSASAFLNTSSLPHLERNNGHYHNNVNASELASTSSGLYDPTFFPSSVPPVAFSADSFLTGLYDNLQPQPQQNTDLSFLESWPFWLATTAANSPESASQNGSNLNVASTTSRPDGKDVQHPQQYAQNQQYYPDSRNPEPDLLADSILIPAIASFFERLHPIMPIFTRSWILDRIDKDEHRSQPSLAAMLLALSSLAKIQPVKAADRISRSQRNEQAKSLLEQSVKLRANAFLGRTHSLDEVLASFYSFATLFGMQEHDAATFRLREAITLAQLMKLNVHESYMFLDHGEQERRLRTYWLLCITERAYALQRGDSIGLRGQPVTDMAFVVASLPDNKLADFPHKQLSLFNNVDEAFVDCWHGRCARAKCSTFTRERARLLHASFGAIFPDQIDENAASSKKISIWQREMIQSIDTTITSHWLQSRLWQICLTHELLSPASQDLILRPAFVLQCAYQAHQFHVAADASSREAHGVGLVEKLFDIGMALLQARTLSSIDEALRSNIDAILSLYVADLKNSSEEGKSFGDRLMTDWQAAGNAYMTAS